MSPLEVRAGIRGARGHASGAGVGTARRPSGQGGFVGGDRRLGPPRRLLSSPYFSMHRVSANILEGIKRATFFLDLPSVSLGYRS